MKALKSILATLLLAGFVGASAMPAWGQSVLAKVRLGNSDYCHMKFPAIQEGTLSSDRHALKDAYTGDVIDFYGPCNYNPAGDREAWLQSLENFRRQVSN